MGKITVFAGVLAIVGLAGCMTPSSSSPPTPASRQAANCSLYIGGYGACLSQCDMSPAPPPMCAPACRPGNPGEAPDCQPDHACEAIAQTQAAARDSERFSCTARCNAMPTECR